MEPLSALSPSKQNARSMRHEEYSPQKHESSFESSPGKVSVMTTAPISPPDSPNANNDQGSLQDVPSSPPRPVSSYSQSLSPLKARSPVKYRLQDEALPRSSPPGSPENPTVRFNEGLTRAISDMQMHAGPIDHEIVDDTTANFDEDMSTIYHSPAKTDAGDDDIDITLSMDNTINVDTTMGDLSTISAVPADMTRFANLRTSPSQTSRPDSWSPSKQLRDSMSVANPAGNRPRPLLLGRKSSGSDENDETPRRPRMSSASPEDLMNFTGITNILIPPPDSAPRTQRRSPSGRGAFPIRVNPTPSHRSQASMDRERAGGRSVQKSIPDRSVPATPASARHSMHGSFNGFGMDLLDIDLEPTATPRSIPSITPRELETLRSELQSRISGLEATLSGKEAEVLALKRAITDAEVRAGKASEDLRTEKLEKEELQSQSENLEKRTIEMEEVLRELKQNAFVEEHEREKLRRQAEEAEKKAEEHEVKILELNATLETLRSERAKSSPSCHKSTEPATPGNQNLADVDAAVKNATETVARELHALYKTKHERKVSDLKVSYEKRWIKQLDQLRAELNEAHDQIMRLESERDATASGSLPSQLQSQSDQISRMQGQIEELRRFNEETVAEKKMLEAEISGLKNQSDSVRQENDILRKQVESERVEKGELVAQVEVFLQVSADQERELERAREREAEQAARERELQREKEALQRERESQRFTPVSPPRSESDASSTTTSSAHPSASVSSPNKFRNSMNGAFVNGATTAHATGGRARPMSMLQKPTGGKFSGIPGPGSSGLKAPTKIANGYTPAGRGGLMEGITRMGAGGR